MIGPSPTTDMANARKARLARIAGRAFHASAPPPAPYAYQPWFEIEAEIPAEIAPAPAPIPQPITVERIKAAVAKDFGVTRLDIDSARRTANVVRPRQVAMYLAKTLTLRSLPDIGRRFGNRDHTTVLHAVRKMERLVEKDPEFAARVASIRESIA